MRRPTLITALPAVALVMAACGPRGGGEIPVLDVTASYPAKNITLQEIATVEYIPLETREKFLIDNFRAHYLDDEIVITTNRTGDIMIFDRHNGRGITSFNRTGRGPGEYPGVLTIAVDREGGEMFVGPNSTSGSGYPIHVYNLEGKHLRTVEYRGINYPRFFHSYDAGHLFRYVDRVTEPFPYTLISKTDTLITPLPVRFEERGTMAVVQRFENGGISSYWNGEPIARTRDGLMLSEPGVDTMWRWTAATNERTPVMRRTPSFNSMEYPIGLFFAAECDDYIFLKAIERRWDFDAGSGFETVNLIYDRNTGEFFEGRAMNGDFADERSFDFGVNAGVPGGTFVRGLQAYELIDLHAAGKLTGRLAEIAPTLKEDDNPVMMITTFK